MLEMEEQKERSRSNWDCVLRYITIYNMLQKKDGEISVETAQEILSNHDGYVCSHQKKIQLGTIWSLIAPSDSPTYSEQKDTHANRNINSTIV
jgi:hypothetical protein